LKPVRSGRGGELENTIERAVVLSSGSTITRDAVTIEAPITAPTASAPSLNLRENIEWIECLTIRRALELSTLKSEAARLMGITPRALAYYLAKYPSIDRRQNRTPPSGVAEWA
jgi:transcriptional regulator with PAS, ATPase and Fis domain